MLALSNQHTRYETQYHFMNLKDLRGAQSNLPLLAINPLISKIRLTLSFQYGIFSIFNGIHKSFSSHTLKKYHFAETTPSFDYCGKKVFLVETQPNL